MKYLIPLILLLSGCSTDSGLIRVTEYDAEATWLPMFGELAGCKLTTSEMPPQLKAGTFEYSGERCTVIIELGDKPDG